MSNRPVGRPGHGPLLWRIPVLGAALLLVAVGQVHAQDEQYGARPAVSDGGRSSGTFILAVEPGASTSDGVEIFNFTNEPSSFDVYAVDVVLTSDGARTPALRNSERTGPAAWIRVDKPIVAVPAQGSLIAPFAVTVPSETPPGAYTAALVVEPLRGETSGTIVNRTRIGLWVEVQVGANGSSAPSPDRQPTWPWLPMIVAGMLGAGAVIYLLMREGKGPWPAGGRNRRAPDDPGSASGRRTPPGHRRPLL
jgi:hypothetical protein